MKNKSYEIWRHEDSRTWKVFTDLTEELRGNLVNTGWNPVIQYKEENTDGLDTCPEEVLRRISRDGAK